MKYLYALFKCSVCSKKWLTQVVCLKDGNVINLYSSKATHCKCEGKNKKAYMKFVKYVLKSNKGVKTDCWKAIQIK